MNLVENRLDEFVYVWRVSVSEVVGVVLELPGVMPISRFVGVAPWSSPESLELCVERCRDVVVCRIRVCTGVPVPKGPGPRGIVRPWTLF